MYMGVLPTLMYVFCVHVLTPSEARGGIRCLELEVQIVVSCRMDAGNQKRVPWEVEEPLVLLTTEPPLQPRDPGFILFCKKSTRCQVR